MNKGKREELRKYLQKLPSRTPLENVTTGDYVELLDALDKAEAGFVEVWSENSVVGEERREPCCNTCGQPLWKDRA